MESNKNNQIKVDGYEIFECLGQGGFGTVYRARQQTTGQAVALKLLDINKNKNEQVQKRQRDRFEREALFCAKLQHPHIVNLLDKGWTHDQTPCAIFEFIPGQTLKDLLLSKGALSAVETGELMGQVLDALSYSHKSGIIHRDLNPYNIIVTTTDTCSHVKVLDFGIATFTQEVRQPDYKTLTMAQETMGTPSYCAPEQLRGEPPTVKSDLYSWGLIFLECLTGHPIMQGLTQAEIMHQQLSALDIPLPQAIIGHPLANLLSRVLRKQPKERAESAAHLYKDLKKLNLNNLVGHLTQTIVKPSQKSSLTSGMKMAPLKSGFLGERRYITVFCCSLNCIYTNETALDIEDVETLQNEQLDLCTDIGNRYGGHFIGDFGGSVLFYFGYPCASDNDSRRAGKAALELMEQVNRKNVSLLEEQQLQLELRIGIHTGMVQVKQDIPKGITPNIAIKLEQLAKPNTVLVSESSCRLLEPYMEFERSESHLIGGSSKPLPTFTLIGERQAEAFMLENKDRPLVGRKSELDHLKQLWNKTKEKQSYAVLLKGEAGIGKSRLIHEMRHIIMKEGFVIQESCCLPEQQNNALYPILEILKHVLHINDMNNPTVVVKQLQSILQNRDCQIDGAIPILCSWLALSLPEDFVPVQYAPEQQKQILFEVIKKLMIETGESRPFILIMEDLHWIDPTSMELLNNIVENKETNVFFLLLTARPEFPSLENEYDTIELQRLSVTDTQLMIQAILGEKRVDEKILKHLADRTGGVPLFIEELVPMVIETEDLVEKNGIYHLNRKFNSTAIPITLQSLLSSKLDRMGPAKETAQIAAIIGREFDYKLLVQSSQKDENLVQFDLEQMLINGLIYNENPDQKRSYIFRHALICDVACDSMLNQDRSKVHGRIAEILETRLSDKTESNPRVVADHFASAGVFEKAVNYGIQAAKIALARFLNEETIAHSNKVLEWIGKIPTEKQSELELEINGILTQALMNTRGWADVRVKRIVDRSQQLLKKMKKNNEYGFPFLWSLGLYHYVAANHQNLCSITDELIHIAEQSGDQGLIVAANNFLGTRYYIGGQYQESKTAFERSLKLYLPKEHKDHGAIFSFDTRSWSAATLALVYWFMGLSERSIMDYGELAISWSRELNHVPSLVISLLYRALAHQYSGDKEAVLEVTRELLTITSKYGLPAFEGCGKVVQYWATGEVEKSDKVLDFLIQSECKVGLTYYGSLAADIEFQNGFPEKAVHRIDSCLSLAKEMVELYYVPELLYKRSRMLLSKYCEGNDNIRTSLEKAADLSRQQGMLRTEVKVISVLLRLFKDENKVREKRLSEILTLRPNLSEIQSTG